MADANILVENADLPGVRQAGQFNTKLPMNLIGAAATLTVAGNVTIGGTLSAGAESVTAQTITSASANAFAVGANGTTNPVLNVDASTSSVATGLNIKGAASGSGLALSVITPGTNENLTLDAAGGGTITIAGVSTGNVNINQALTVNKASAFAFDVKANSHDIFVVNTNTTSIATGLTVIGAAAAGGVQLNVLSSGSNENMLLNGKGTGTINVQAATATPAAGSAQAALLLGSTAAFGIYFGSGAPTVSAAQGSIYLRSDGSSSSTRVYVNSTGSTTWVAITTAS